MVECIYVTSLKRMPLSYLVWYREFWPFICLTQLIKCNFHVRQCFNRLILWKKEWKEKFNEWKSQAPAEIGSFRSCDVGHLLLQLTPLSCCSQIAHNIEGSWEQRRGALPQIHNSWARGIDVGAKEVPPLVWRIVWTPRCGCSEKNN